MNKIDPANTLSPDTAQRRATVVRWVGWACVLFTMGSAILLYASWGCTTLPAPVSTGIGLTYVGTVSLLIARDALPITHRLHPLFLYGGVVITILAGLVVMISLLSIIQAGRC